LIGCSPACSLFSAPRASGFMRGNPGVSISGCPCRTHAWCFRSFADKEISRRLIRIPRGLGFRWGSDWCRDLAVVLSCCDPSQDWIVEENRSCCRQRLRAPWFLWDCPLQRRRRISWFLPLRPRLHPPQLYQEFYATTS
jgi:hypothetical protein